VADFNGAPGVTRTPDLLVRSQRVMRNQRLRTDIAGLIRMCINLYITITCRNRPGQPRSAYHIRLCVSWAYQGAYRRFGIFESISVEDGPM